MNRIQRIQLLQDSDVVSRDSGDSILLASCRVQLPVSHPVTAPQGLHSLYCPRPALIKDKAEQQLG